MTTKELIREKIDSFYAEYKAKFHQNGDSYHLGIIDGLDMAERILDTLPDEPVTDCHDLTEAAEKYADGPECSWVGTSALEQAFKAGAEWGAAHLRDTAKKVSEDLDELEKEIDRFEDWMETYNQADYPTSFTTRDIARHFAQWGVKHARKEKTPEDLMEAADDHIRKVVDAAGHPGWDWETRDIVDAFKAGAEWQKRKMIEGATYNELMELYRAIRDELVKRHCDVPVNIKEEQ